MLCQAILQRIHPGKIHSQILDLFKHWGSVNYRFCWDGSLMVMVDINHAHIGECQTEERTGLSGVTEQIQIHNRRYQQSAAFDQWENWKRFAGIQRLYKRVPLLRMVLTRAIQWWIKNLLLGICKYIFLIFNGDRKKALALLSCSNRIEQRNYVFRCEHKLVRLSIQRIINIWRYSDNLFSCECSTML